MRFFVKAIATGFAMSMGGALFSQGRKETRSGQRQRGRGEGVVRHRMTQNEFVDIEDVDGSAGEPGNAR